MTLPEVPRSEIRRADRLARSPYEFLACHHPASIATGMLFHRTNVALRIWLLAIFWMAVDTRGALS